MIKIFITFLAIAGGVSISMNVFDIEFLYKDYWKEHGVLLLIGLTIFPRLTLLFSSIASGGFLWWVAWFFAPRILVAVLATISYWHNHPILVLFSWLVALGGESGEKHLITSRSVTIRTTGPKFYRNDSFDNNDPDTIEADFERKS
ncbi:MAG: hypothetical protein GY909_04655 [Oligoflexia bacterium]|nr:hypothetical protein [Oligoflexia bacterium]